MVMLSVPVSLPIPPPVSARSLYGFAMGPLKRHFWMLLAVSIVGAVLQSFGNVFQGAMTGPESEGASAIAVSLSGLFSVLVGQPVLYGIGYTYLRTVRGEPPQFDDVIRMFKFNYLAVVLSSIVVGVAVAIGIILLVIPGIYIGARLSLVSYLVADQGLGVDAALRESWRLTSGKVWLIIKLWILAIPIMIVGLILLFIGIIPAFMWVYMTAATLYESIRVADAPLPVSKSAFSE